MAEKNKNSNSIPPGMKLGRKWGYIIAGILAVAAPAWTGALNSMGTGAVADQAVSQSFEAIEKSSLTYELLAQKQQMDNEGIIKELERHEKRMDKIEEKLDRLLLRSARRWGGSQELDEIKAMASNEVEENVEPLRQMTLPKNLDLAYKTRKAAAATKAAAGL